MAEVELPSGQRSSEQLGGASSASPSVVQDASLHSLLPPSSPTPLLLSLALSSIGGASLGLIVLYVLMASTLLLPSLVHHTIALLVFPVLGAIAAAASYLALRICASRNPRFKQRCHRLIGSRGTHRAMLQGVGGLVLLTTLLLLLPTPAQADLWVAFNTILESMMGGQLTLLPQGYCQSARDILASPHPSSSRPFPPLPSHPLPSPSRPAPSPSPSPPRPSPAVRLAPPLAPLLSHPCSYPPSYAKSLDVRCENRLFRCQRERISPALVACVGGNA